MTRPHNQKGFSAIEGLLIFVIVAIIGGVGFFVYHSTQKASDTLDAADASSRSAAKFTKKKTAETKKDETSDWLLYQAPSGAFSLRLPDGWALNRYQQSDSLFAISASNTTYSKGKTAVVTQEEGGKDYANVSFMLNYGDASTKIPSYDDAKEVTGFTTSQGLKVKKYTRTQTEEQKFLGPSQGTVTYLYYITKDSHVVLIEHDIASGEGDKTALIEQSLKTLNVR